MLFYILLLGSILKDIYNAYHANYNGLILDIYHAIYLVYFENFKIILFFIMENNLDHIIDMT
jgi:hypothetical protein